MVTLAILLCSVHEHGICLHLFMSALFSLSSGLCFLAYRSFSSVVTFIHKWFIHFDAIANDTYILKFQPVANG